MHPVETFREAFHNFPDILKTIEKQGFASPSPIQSQAWPYLLSGKDMIGIAQTGTGKTLAFLLPCFILQIHRMGNDQVGWGTRTELIKVYHLSRIVVFG